MRILNHAGLLAWISTSLLVSSIALPAFAASGPDKYDITVLGGDETSFTPAPNPGEVIEDLRQFDTIIVGGGLGGLSAAVYLSNQGKQVLLLEKEAHLGGLAASGSTKSGIHYDRGAAYFTKPYEEELAILTDIGLADYEKYAIHDAIDNYYLHGKLYVDIWSDATVAELPASFELFKYELQQADIPDQPLEEAADRSLDSTTAAKWIRSMPASLAARKDDAEAMRILKRFKSDPRVSASDPMIEVIHLMDLYCRSALGSTSDQVSALAFANFYISEISTRYTTPTGTAGAAELMETKLRARKNLVTIETSSPVGQIVNWPDEVEVTYSNDGHEYRAHGKYVVFAGELKIAPKLIKDFAKADPVRAKLINELKYANYAVHTVFLDGHPYRASYDTWTRADNYTDQDFTDVILGRWQDPLINGYQGIGFGQASPPDNEGIFTIYHPLPLATKTPIFNESKAKKLATWAVDRLKDIYSKYLFDHWGSRIDVKSIETSRWPYSVHLAEPRHFLDKARILRRNLGRIYFANNNIGTPAFEEALFRGHCAAVNVLTQLNPGYQRESWSKCPIEAQASPNP